MNAEISIHLRDGDFLEVRRKASMNSFQTQWLELGDRLYVHGTPEQLDALIDRLTALKGTLSKGTSVVEEALQEA